MPAPLSRRTRQETSYRRTNTTSGRQSRSRLGEGCFPSRVFWETPFHSRAAEFWERARRAREVRSRLWEGKAAAIFVVLLPAQIAPANRTARTRKPPASTR